MTSPRVDSLNLMDVTVIGKSVTALGVRGSIMHACAGQRAARTSNVERGAVVLSQLADRDRLLSGGRVDCHSVAGSGAEQRLSNR